MAQTLKSDRLAQQFQERQSSLVDKAIAAVVANWAREMKSGDIRTAADKWLTLAVPYIMAANRASVPYGGAYFKANRRLEVPNAPRLVLPPADILEREQVTTSLWVTGVNPLLRGGDVDLEVIETELSGAIARHVQNGGRSKLDNAIKKDPLALAWHRETDGDPCYFCAMLASRTNYKSDSFDDSDFRFSGPGDAKVHDSCGCHLRPDYKKGDSESVTKYAELWSNRGPNRDGEDDVAAFRRYYNGLQASKVETLAA